MPPTIEAAPSMMQLTFAPMISEATPAVKASILVTVNVAAAPAVKVVLMANLLASSPTTVERLNVTVTTANSNLTFGNTHPVAISHVPVAR